MQPVTSIESERVGDLVARDIRLAKVFKKHGIEFCCGGGISVSEACRRLGVDQNVVIAAVQEATAEPDRNALRASEWTPAFLVDYIETVHHTYVRETLPVLTAFTTKVARVHGAAQPELEAIRDTFSALATEMTEHMAFEEDVLFPAIREGRLEEARDLVGRAEDEHVQAGSLMARLRELSADFTPPDWACATYRAAFATLEEFETDLHTHVHLENNVLFQKLGQS